MPKLHAGALVERAPGPQYTASLRFAELGLRAPMPKPGTLRKTAASLPAGFALSLVAPKTSVTGGKGALRFDEKLDEGVAWLGAAATALAAKFVVVPTATDVTTGQRDRDLLAAYVEVLRAKAGGAAIVWAPTGLWEPDAAAKYAERIGVIAAFDALDADVPRGEVVYARLQAIGARARFGDDALLGVLEKLATSPAADAYVAIDSPRSFREASRLEALLRSATELAASGEADEDEDEDALDDDEDGDADGDDDEEPDEDGDAGDDA